MRETLCVTVLAAALAAPALATDLEVRLVDPAGHALSADLLQARTPEGELAGAVQNPDGSCVFQGLGAKAHLQLTYKGGTTFLPVRLPDAPSVRMTVCLDPRTGEAKPVEQSTVQSRPRRPRRARRPGNTGSLAGPTSPPAPVAGDDCSQALAVGGNSTTTIDNTHATEDAADPRFQNRFAGPGQGVGTVWLRFVAEDSTALVSTARSAARDTLLGVYEIAAASFLDGPCGNLREICSSDDQVGYHGELVCHDLVPGRTYYVQAASYSDSYRGSITLDVLSPAPPGDLPPPNDECDGAIPLDIGDGVLGDNSSATDDIAQPCGVPSIFRNVWYAVLGNGNTLSASTCNIDTTLDTVLSVYCGTCDDLVCVAGNDDNCNGRFQSTVTWCTQPGVTYLVTVGSWEDGASGAFRLDIEDLGGPCTSAVQCLATGACCLPGAVCAILNEDECATRGGNFLGEGTDCFEDAVADGGFETGTPNASWTEFSTNFGTPICTPDFCGVGGGTGPYKGNWWAWFGGTRAFEAGSLSQSVVIPSGATNLEFWLEIPVASGNGEDYLNVWMDGDLLASYGESDGPFGYQLVQLPIGAYADGGAHTLLFESETTGDGLTNFFVDNVSIHRQAVDCKECVVFDFETEDDFVTPLVNGQDITWGIEFGRLVEISGIGNSAGLPPVIFDTDPGGPNFILDEDPDLLVDCGNALILQEDPGYSAPGIYYEPDDDEFGGFLDFFFYTPGEVRSLKLIDIDQGPGPQDAFVYVVDTRGLYRVYHCPSGWTEDVEKDGPPGYRVLDLTTTDPQPGFLSTAEMVLEYEEFDPCAVILVEIQFSGSGAVDDVEYCFVPPVEEEN